MACVLQRLLTACAGVFALLTGPFQAQAAEKQPNILVIMADDVGWFNGIFASSACKIGKSLFFKSPGNILKF